MRLTLHLAAAADYPAYAQLTRQARMRAWRKQYAHLDEARVDRRAGRVVPRAARQRRDPRARRRLRRRDDGPVDAGHLRPHAAAADPAPARRALGRQAARRVRPRPAPAARPRRRGHARARALPRRLRAGEQARRRRLGRRRPASTSRRPGSGSRRSPTRRDGGCTTSRARRCRPPTHRCRRACSPTGTSRCSPTPTASASWPPRSQALELTLSGDPTVTVDGRVAASWDSSARATPCS